ncbi:DsbA family protein [Marinomonas sp. CT5]|uniref:DsbA family protein n=1 Tax=Marinomonas sp. CT5 TaxID=2066133 RepID=UPI0017A50BF8|nr:DsbA family protein [Marinomonas sp. CT5]NVK73507.1 DsbA family protein [Oceanospirillaceae bacterium]QUX97951.1 DsbA family protein [Marinomonas sp. CT5]
MTATLIYCYDPMCSWCWGFRPTWSKLQKALQDLVDKNQLTIQPMLGGLAIDSDKAMPDEMKSKLEATWHKIQNTLGSEFNFDFWRNAAPRRSTYPACRACYVARDTGLEEEMYHVIQEAYYLKAKNPSNLNTLIECAESIGMNADGFEKAMQHVKNQGLLEEEVEQARHLGLNSFPSLALLIGDKLTPIPLDYKDHSSMLRAIKKALL